MSKRIMNELMCLAEDVGVDIYYQDTDSTHTPVKDIPLLKEAYLKKYGRELEGSPLLSSFLVNYSMQSSSKTSRR